MTVSPLDENTSCRKTDDFYLDRAIDVAWQAAGRTQPNPLVGALVVNKGRILSVGHHQVYGEAHAETIALDAAGEASRGSTLYVTLEPCAHHGNTAPCVDDIIQRGIRRVVVPTLDPDKRVNGHGVEVLRENGVKVDVGIGVERALLLNMPYFKRVLGMGPVVTLKMAMTLDGRIASQPGSRDEITGIEARRMVHRLRAVHSGVLVGINTFTVDKPRLDCRLLDSVDPPTPVVLDTKLRYPIAHGWPRDRNAIVVTANDSTAVKENELVKAGVSVIRCDTTDNGINLSDAMNKLYGEGLESILVEGGGRVFSSFVDADHWDGMYLFVSPAFYGPHGVSVSDRPIDQTKIGAVLAGVSTIAGEVVMSFISDKTRRDLLDRLLPEGE